MSDRDKTPPMTKAGRAKSQAESRPSIMIPANEDGDTERRDRRAVIWDDSARASTASERARRSPGRVRDLLPDDSGIPQDGDKWEVTSPHDLLSRELDDSGRAIAARMKSPTDTPADMRGLINLAQHSNKHDAENKSAITALANALLKIEAATAPAQIAAINMRLDGTPDKPGIEGRLGRVETMMKTIRIAMFLLLGGSGGYGIVIAEKIWDRAEREGESTIRLQHVERQLDDVSKQLRETLRYSPALPSWLQPPQQKDRTP